MRLPMLLVNHDEPSALRTLRHSLGSNLQARGLKIKNIVMYPV